VCSLRLSQQTALTSPLYNSDSQYLFVRASRATKVYVTSPQQKNCLHTQPLSARNLFKPSLKNSQQTVRLVSTFCNSFTETLTSCPTRLYFRFRNALFARVSQCNSHCAEAGSVGQQVPHFSTKSEALITFTARTLNQCTPFL
jgi:hypothetical protein